MSSSTCPLLLIVKPREQRIATTVVLTAAAPNLWRGAWESGSRAGPPTPLPTDVKTLNNLFITSFPLNLSKQSDDALYGNAPSIDVGKREIFGKTCHVSTAQPVLYTAVVFA